MRTSSCESVDMMSAMLYLFSHIGDSLLDMILGAVVH